MKTTKVFGTEYPVIEKEGSMEAVRLEKCQITIDSTSNNSDRLLGEFLSDLLFDKMREITERIKKEGKIDLLGKLEFEIVEKIDNRENRLAKIKGNKVIVKLDAVTLQEDVLKYILVHELAHIGNKRHTKKFWKTVKLMYPNFQEAKKRLSMFHVKHDRK